MGMADRAALAPIPDQGTERDELELTETAETLAVSRQKRPDGYGGGALTQLT
jgi:hypothetical protein